METASDPTYIIYNFMQTWMSPKIALILVVMILVLIIVFISGDSSSGNSDLFQDFSPSNKSFYNLNNSTSKTSLQSILMYIFIALLLIFVIVQFFWIFLHVDLVDYFRNLFSNVQQVVTDEPNNNDSAPVPEIEYRKQVYNIPGNYYTYDNAKAVCSAYGSELATYEQLEDAYNNGAEWCNYGWSANQNALFPTQLNTYNNLQKIEGHENDCGRPGINGGYIGNPQVRFGVNCYGHKPKITSEEAELMQNTTPYPQTAKDIAFQKQVDFWKTKASEILVSPFNYKSWTEIF